MNASSKSEPSGVLKGHVQKGKLFQPALVAMGVLETTNWYRDGLPALQARSSTSAFIAAGESWSPPFDGSGEHVCALSTFHRHKDVGFIRDAHVQESSKRLTNQYALRSLSE